jgi:hypothetical protein
MDTHTKFISPGPAALCPFVTYFVRNTYSDYNWKQISIFLEAYLSQLGLFYKYGLFMDRIKVAQVESIGGILWTRF